VKPTAHTGFGIDYNFFGTTISIVLAILLFDFICLIFKLHLSRLVISRKRLSN
jgi:hypothetical protein